MAPDTATSARGPDSPAHRGVDDQAVSMGFWHRSPRRGPHRASRRLATAPLTLAEVYAMRNGLAVDRPADSGTGQYL
ncbi:MAG TPA: DUF5925 domain-containing protein [Streptosporangiaceae bacterium]|nr:DUF5925 domain-containing protein [Streptosporangiaceae bacterium]